MERVPLQSRAVVSAGYDADKCVLEIEFSGGRVYRFTDVAASVYDWLLRVPNKGLYVSRSITDRYPFEDVTSASAVDLEALLEASVTAGGEESRPRGG